MNVIERLRAIHHSHYQAINEYGIYVVSDSYLEEIIIFEKWYKVSESEVAMWHSFVAEQLSYMDWQKENAYNFTDLQQYLESIVMFDQYMEFLNERL